MPALPRASGSNVPQGLDVSSPQSSSAKFFCRHKPHVSASVRNRGVLAGSNVRRCEPAGRATNLAEPSTHVLPAYIIILDVQGDSSDGGRRVPQ